LSFGTYTEKPVNLASSTFCYEFPH